MIAPLEKRFHAQYLPEPMSGCWLWTGNTNGRYGTLGFNNKPLYAHRFSYELYHGKFDKKLDVCHKCDVNLCVNPQHLFVGSRKDNMRDCLLKGRFAHGSKHKNAKLNEQAIVEIIQSYDNGFKNQRELAEQFGVTQTLIGRIVRGKSWKHVPR